MKAFQYLISITILLASHYSFAQDLQRIKVSIDSLSECNSQLKSKIAENNKKIDQLKQKEILLDLYKFQNNIIKVILNSPTRILNERYVFADTIIVAKKSDTIEIIGYGKDYYTAKYKYKIGYISSYLIPNTDDLIKFKEFSLLNLLNNETDPDKKDIIQHDINIFNKQKIEYTNQKIDAQKALEQIKIQAEIDKKENEILKIQKKKRQDDLFKKYGSSIGQKILDGKIWIGMTSEMAKDSWGLPTKNNRTVGSFGVHEQWVYSSSYVYFENGILTSWQD